VAVVQQTAMDAIGTDQSTFNFTVSSTLGILEASVTPRSAKQMEG